MTPRTRSVSASHETRRHERLARFTHGQLEGSGGPHGRVLTAVDGDDPQLYRLERAPIDRLKVVGGESVKTKNTADDVLESADMIVAAGEHRPLPSGLDQATGLVSLVRRRLEVDHILGERPLVGVEYRDDVFDEDRLGAHVADDAAGLQRAAEATIDDDLGLTLASEIQVKQLRVEQPDEERTHAGQGRDGRAVLGNPIHHIGARNLFPQGIAVRHA